MHTYLVCALLEGFYSAKESVTILLTEYFDFLCNDDCLAGD